jgi:chaperone required for assembly of F1-ATPase
VQQLFQEVITTKTDEGNVFFANGKPLRTKKGKILRAPNEEIAAEIVSEWKSQKVKVAIETMPFTHILNTKIDRVASGRNAVIAGLLKYIDTDLICYYAPGPQELVMLQRQRWDPFRLWFSQHFACELKTTDSLQAQLQPEKAKQAVFEKMGKMNDDILTLLLWVASLGGSLVMALAFVQQAFGTEQILHSRFVDEDYRTSLLNAAGIQEEHQEFILTKGRVRKDLEASSKYLLSIL